MTTILNSDTKINTMIGSSITTASASSIGNSMLSDSKSLTVNGKMFVNGRDLEERLEVIERVLGIPEAPAEMFEKYPSLKEKYYSYINELAKKRTWEALK